jgi:hypothetical protein
VVGPHRFDLTDVLERVLAEPRFQTPTESWWDRFWARVVAEAARLVAAVIEAVGGPVVAAFLALGIVGAITLLVAFRLAGRRAAVVEDRLALGRLLEVGADPASYLREAEEATRAGDHSRAIRLRFVGEVLDWGRRGRIRYSPGLTTAAIAEQVDDAEFQLLADQFDRIAYGGAAAGAEENADSRRRWAALKAGR